MSLALVPGPSTPTSVTITATAGTVSGSATLTVRPAGFVLTGSLSTPRYYQSAILLNNGSVLVVGGDNSSGALASAELYNSATGTFTSTGNMNTARASFTATLLNNGLVLIAGGGNVATPPWPAPSFIIPPPAPLPLRQPEHRPQQSHGDTPWQRLGVNFRGP